MSFEIHPWKVVETGLDKERMRLSESLTSTGNGYMGMRGNFEEDYTDDTHLGTYIGGVWFPDKTRVGWWKNGYPLYFGKVINAVRLNGIHVEVDGETLDLNTAQVEAFYRELDMQNGLFLRRFTVRTAGGSVQVEAERFVSLAQKELLAVRYRLTPDYDAHVVMRPYLDANVRNLDSNYEETFWDMLEEEETEDALALLTKTKENPFGTPRFAVSAAMSCWADGLEMAGRRLGRGYVETRYEGDGAAGEDVVMEKYALCFTSRDYDEKVLSTLSLKAAARAREVGYDALRDAHTAAWRDRWAGCDVTIQGDDAAQQGIRFCIFMLLQTYTGVDTRLNIGPKGFTGEKYGGVTYWDTEAYCLPFYLATAGQAVARELLVYRYNQLDKAIENAAKLGFRDGAALYPMVTVNGEECHNEWEITFEEIHRNGAVAYAIFNYIRYTGDTAYLADCGLEVLLSVARFWAQRITWSGARRKYVMLGVTGPNEYENNVDNNWYTSYIACWSMRYAAEAARWVRENRPADYARICAKRRFDETAETKRWLEIADGMYFGEDRELGIFLQQDGYLDKEQILAGDLDPAERPINQRWSWDRILRSCLIKQADVLQGLYFFGDDFDLDTVRRNFRFYEARTVHESSLSPCVHAILAARIGDLDKAYELYLRTARLDLDDYNREVREGCHVTSMAGSWLSVVEGFGGMRVRDGVLSFDPQLPAAWESLSFKVNFRDRVLTVRITRNAVEVANEGAPVELEIRGVRRLIADKVIMNCEL